MNEDWKKFLTDAGADFTDDSVNHFGSPVRELKISSAGSFITPLTHQSLICAAGSDAINFLQGQLTNDVTHVDATHSQLSGYCNPQGRLLALFRLFMHQDNIILSLPVASFEATLKRLSLFLLNAQLTLTRCDDKLIGIGLSGPKCDKQLATLFEEIPSTVDSCVQQADMTLNRIAGQQPRYEIYGPLEAIQTLWGKLDVHAAPVGPAVWEYHDILAGLPKITPESAAQFIPQMINLQAINGLNFKKGCYTGQEIVARLQYRGKLKRRMYRVNIASDDIPSPGDALYLRSDGHDQAIGNIVNAQASADDGCTALAVIINEFATQPGIHLNGADGPELSLAELPYSIKESE